MAYHVKQKGEEKESHIAGSFLAACKWCVNYADLVGDNFEVVRVEKRERYVTVEKECEYEVVS